MKKFFKNILSFFLGRKLSYKFFAFLHLLSLKGMNFGGGAMPAFSGEAFVIKYVLKKQPDIQIVFDVGANKGEYSELWLNERNGNKSFKILIFEPAKALAKDLMNKFKNFPVLVFNVAFGEKTGESVLFSDSPGSGLASLLNRDLGHLRASLHFTETVMVTTLDSFCEKNQIEKIDFLKLDVEGYEFSVLKGAAAMLKNKKIRFIQFEFGGTDIDARVFFKDFFRLLSPDYSLFLILKDGLSPISQYSETQEIFITSNYLAELKN